MLIDKAEIELVKRANELVAFIRSRGVTLTQRGKQLVGLCSMMTTSRASSSSGVMSDEGFEDGGDLLLPTARESRGSFK